MYNPIDSTILIRLKQSKAVLTCLPLDRDFIWVGITHQKNLIAANLKPRLTGFSAVWLKIGENYQVTKEYLILEFLKHE